MKKYWLIALLVFCLAACVEEQNSQEEEQVEAPKEEIIKLIDEKCFNTGYHTVTEVDGHRYYSIIRYDGGVAMTHLPSCKCFNDTTDHERNN